MRRVAITGMGTVNPLAHTLADSWQALIENRCGVKEYMNDPILRNQVPYNLALINPTFDYKKFRIPHADSRMNCFINSSVQEALRQSQILEQDLSRHKERVGVCLGIMSSNISKLQQFSAESSHDQYRSINRLSMLQILSNIPAGSLNVRYGLHGPSLTVSTACASGLSAVVEAFKWIQLGEADLVIAGGAEDIYNPLCLNSALRIQAMSTRKYADPSSSSRPFDKERSGFILGEGAGILILEEIESAKERGASILCEIMGYGYTSDGYHLVRPQGLGQGQKRSMELALKMSGIPAHEIDCINAHATSTEAGDLIQANSIKQVFNSQGKQPIVSALKSSIGHTFGAAGAIQLILGIQSMRESVVPKILNLSTPDVEGIRFARQNMNTPIKYLLKNSFGFGGVNVSMVVKNYD